MRRKLRQTGYTLIELIAVVTIITLLTSTAITQYRNILHRVEKAMFHQMRSDVQSAVAQFYAKQGRMPWSPREFASRQGLAASVYETINVSPNDSSCRPQTTNFILCFGTSYSANLRRFNTVQQMRMYFINSSRYGSPNSASRDTVYFRYQRGGAWSQCGAGQQAGC